MSTYSNTKLSIPIFKTITLFLILFLLFGISLWAIVAIFYKVQFKSIVSSLAIQENHTVALQKSHIGQNVNEIISDLLFLTRENELKAHLQSDSGEMLEAMAIEYRELASVKKMYDQLRYIDDSGQEIVRVNYNNGQPRIVDKQNLQNKYKRYYFTDSFRLNQGEIFISPLDLNVERGELEQPFKPMIRIGTPVFDSNGQKRGIVLINYLAQTFLDDIMRISKLSRGEPMLLNKNGYWLLNSDSRKEWGFMVKERGDCNFAKVYPEEWEQIRQSENGQLQTKNGLFTFTTIYPLRDGCVSSTGAKEAFTSSAKRLNSSEYFWVMVSHISDQSMDDYVTPLQFRIFFFGSGLLVLISLGAWFLALAITKHRLYQQKLISMALHDELTSLPNRKYFFDQLTRGIAHAERYGHQLGLLYIDLDGFKEINDNFGHEAGDAVLVEVSKRMLSITRKADTVSRIGGDEFAIVLFQVDCKQSITSIGHKIIDKINNPISFHGNRVTVGASVGAAVYPDTEEDPNKLLKLADQAMYISKSKGKNTCTLSSGSE